MNLQRTDIETLKTVSFLGLSVLLLTKETYPPNYLDIYHEQVKPRPIF